MKLDGVVLIATPRYTHVSRGSSSIHPNAIDFGWNGAGTQNQPLYSGIIGSKDVSVARKRYSAGGIGSGATGYVVDIRFETENYTCYRSSMHMSSESPLSVGTKLNWNTVVGYMGSTGDSTGPHDHVILAICPKGTPVERMYDYRVKPDDYYYYLNDWHVADNQLPWIDLDEGGGGTDPSTPFDKEKLVIITKNTEIEKEFKMGKRYEVTEIKDDQIILTEIKNVQIVNEYDQAVFEGSNIEFSTIYNKANGGKASTPYHTNGSGRGYGKVIEVLKNSQAPYKVELNGSVIGFVAPVNTY